LVVIFRESTDVVVLARRLERIEQGVLVSLCLRTAKNPPVDIKVFGTSECYPRPNWSENDDQALIWPVYQLGYSAFRDSFPYCHLGMLCERLGVLCREYRRYFATESSHTGEVADRAPKLRAWKAQAGLRSDPRVTMPEAVLESSIRITSDPENASEVTHPWV
jgi:hypothetical protein